MIETVMNIKYDYRYCSQTLTYTKWYASGIRQLLVYTFMVVLTFLQVADGLVVVLQLQVTLAQEEVSLD